MSPKVSVTDRLRQDILSGGLAPGERLVELQLTKRYGVGRASIRHALVELGKEGLVVRLVNRGSMVRRVTVEEAIEITEARAALESLVVRYAARNSTAKEKAELKKIVQRMKRAVKAENNLAYSELNRLFHRRLREISQHRVALELVENLRNRAAHQQYRLALVPGRARESLAQHAAIADAVVKGDEDRAAAAMQAHLDSVIAMLHLWLAAGLKS